MRRIITSTALFGLFVISVLFLPVNLAGHTAGPAFVGIYFDDPTVSFKLPAGTTKTKSITTPVQGSPPVALPAAAPGVVTFAGLKIPKPLKPATHVIGEVWLASTGQKTALTGIDIEIVKLGGANPVFLSKIHAGFPRAADQTPAVLLDTTPQRFWVTDETTKWTTEQAADTTLGLRITVTGVAVKQDGSPVDIVLSYGSAQYPSGVYFGANKDPGAIALGAGLALYLDEGKLSTAYPTGTPDKKRASGNTGNTLQQAPEWEWGKIKIAEKFTVVSDAIFNVTNALKGPAPAAGAQVGLDVFLYVNGQKVARGNSSFGPDTPVWATGNAPVKAFIIALPTRGLVIPANSEISIKLASYSPAAESFEFLYGAKARASSLVMGVASGSASSSYSSASNTGSASSSSGASSSGSASNSVSVSVSASASASVSGSALAAPPDGKKSPGVELGILVAAIGAVGVIVARRRK